VNVVQAASTMTLSGDISVGTTTLQTIKNGAGTLAMKNVRMAAATINAGTLGILANGTNAGASKVGTLTVAGGATPTAALDLNDNDIVISSPGAGTISSLIFNARHAGAWIARVSRAALREAIHPTTRHWVSSPAPNTPA
jgi:hypothetical protein